MKILWFTENYPPNKGGMSRSCDRIIHSLREHATVDIYHFTNKQKPFTTQANIGGSYTTVPVFEDSSHTLNVLWAHMTTKLSDLKDAVLVAYGSHLALKGVPLFAKWAALPYLLCLRGNDFDTAIFSSKKVDLLYAIGNAAAIACVSSEKVSRIQRMKLNDQVFFTPNAIASDGWEVLEADRSWAAKIKTSMVSKNATVIGLVGYLKEKKGIDFFVTTLLKSVLATQIHLRIVGELAPAIEEKLNSLEVPYSVVIPESRSELIANYLSCDTIAIPSLYDGMPNVLFEAAVLGIPIIASKAGGLPDVLDETTAFMFEVLSEASLLESIATFKATTAKERELRCKRLQKKLKKNFTPEKEVENYLNIFKQIH